VQPDAIVAAARAVMRMILLNVILQVVTVGSGKA
jgi:hypothetical protein